ncbi:MAG TPA: peptidyl-prolyl cis-trans isomerase [Gammaproteobacteria bacterium]
MLGCTQRDAPGEANPALGPGRVATVNGEPLPESVFLYYVRNVLQRDPDGLSEEERQRVLDDLIQVKLLAEEAEARGIDQERTVAVELELRRLQHLARVLAVRHMEQNPATEEEIRAKYEESLPRLAPTEYKTRHILVETDEAARAVIQRLDAGEDFATVAAEQSRGPTAQNGGDLGWLSAQSMVPPVGAAVQALEVGTYTKEPVRTEYGYHVILLEETRQPEPPALESVRAELVDAVGRDKLAALIESLKSEAEITTGPEPSAAGG